MGLNYKDHTKEVNLDLPKEPLLFIKPSTSIISSNEYIVYPNNVKILDFEVELAIVMLDKFTKLILHMIYLLQ